MNAAFFGGFPDQILLLDLSPQDPRGVHHRVDQRDVARTAAGVPVNLEPIANLLARGAGVLLEQRIGGDDEAG